MMNLDYLLNDFFMQCIYKYSTVCPETVYPETLYPDTVYPETVCPETGLRIKYL